MSVLHLLLGLNNSGKASFSTAQCELLLCLSSQRIDLQMEQAWTPIVGPLEHNIARFVSRGFLEEAPLADRFDAKYRVTDLKQMLENKGIKAKGKKSEMITAFINAIPPADAEALVADIRLFRPTPAGSHRIESYIEMKEKALQEMESETLSLLLKSDVRRAWSRMGRYQMSQMFPDPKWARSVPEPLLEEAACLMRLSYDDLPLDETHRKMAGAHLAMSVMLGESFADTGKRLMRFTEGLFDWTQATFFSRPNPCGQETVSDPASLAEMYAMTRIKEALSHCELNSLRSVRIGKGIKILPVHCADCSICNGGKYHYEWSEIDLLPRLPRQMGCQCTYVAWL
ncbi:MAG: SAP domain-containing protein [Methanocella sp.]